MHRLFNKKDTEKIARLITSELARNFKKSIKDRYVGLLFGKYDLLLQCRPISQEAMYQFNRDFRKWIWDLKIDDFQVKGCVSTITCHEIVHRTSGQNKLSRRISKRAFAINSYSFFRLTRYSDELLSRILDEVAANQQEDLDLALCWNPSSLSYTLKTSGDSFDKMLNFLFKFRESEFFQDFCTFVTLKSGASDRKHEYGGIKAMINVKLSGSGLADPFVDRFENARFRMGYFDVVRNIDCSNLSSAFDCIQETRDFLVGAALGVPACRTATILSFDKTSLGKRGRD